jgi:hypothetical protein
MPLPARFSGRGEGEHIPIRIHQAEAWCYAENMCTGILKEPEFVDNSFEAKRVWTQLLLSN